MFLDLENQHDEWRCVLTQPLECPVRNFGCGGSICSDPQRLNWNFLNAEKLYQGKSVCLLTSLEKYVK